MAIQVASQASAEAMAGAKLELTDQRNVVVGDAVVGYGLWRMTMPVPDGPPMMMEGRYTDVKVMRDGKWLYMVDHASAPLPPPPAG
jgi:ketosteroid isomerase-like protein